MRYAIVDGTDVVNVIIWDGEEEYPPPDGCLVIPAPDEVSVGWTYVDGVYHSPNVPPVDPALSLK